MNKDETKAFEDLKKEVETLRSELESLREFVKTLYSLVEGGEQYDAPEGLPSGIDFGRINT